MDVDMAMAMQRSRVRRDTVSDDVDPTMDLRDHLNPTQDPSLLVGQHDESVIALPTYQPIQSPVIPHVQSRSVFDFGQMEEFASNERLAMQQNQTTAKFSIPPRTQQRPLTDEILRPVLLGSAQASNEAVQSSQSLDPSPQPIPTPSRRLSESNTPPRTRPRQRKGIGGKLAMFESSNNVGGHESNVNSFLGIPGLPPPTGPVGNSTASSFENLPTVYNSGVVSKYGQNVPGTSSAGGALNTGHDRPYRFSFYSNALSTTIHARSLHELPAEGQTFEELFTGVKPGDRDKEKDLLGKGSDEITKPKEKERPISSGAGRGYFSSNMKPRRSALLSGGSFGGFTGAFGSVEEEAEANTWWLDVTSPTDEEMRILSKVFNIHPLTSEDIQMEETREKIELFRNYYFVCFRSFDQDPYSPTHLEPLNMYIIVFREGTLSFHFHPTPHPSSVRRRIKQLKDYISVTSDWISYALIDDITDAFGPLIQSIEYEVDSIDELVLILKDTTSQSDMLRRIGTCRKKVMGLLRLMGSKADVVKGLAKRCNENWQVAPTGEIGLYLSDIQDHLITMTQSLNHYEKILSRSHSNYLAQISIEMTEANNQINDVLSKLTALGTVLIPMNLVTGLWGMNVHVPGQASEDDAGTFYWFGGIVAVLGVFAIVGGYGTYKLLVRGREVEAGK
ncbi:cora-domain-containing protein [Dendrothele bispora CBS 962.96]|uniref:Cora-domain-containing protein n=1 Tax=Dendrothele bispora (strain CBS 962.96) TaxID=1314807 RepID=A0A4S8MY68_DENBC|nr:cora-domain-containing protein [Dendrothele bispora CBS 962.96]